MPESSAEHIRDILIEEDLRESYLNYAMSVIVSRALPDARDGLKPSQRRILVAMNDLNLGPRSRFRKSATIAGETIGHYHPHGTEVVYPTLARMAQDFSARYLLVDPQGNFGSIDGDPPAAMRYTEARLSFASTEMLEDLEKDTVDFVPNFDGTTTEPTILPSRFPNLLCNGSSGIAVGMATSIPPHNLCEVADGLIKLVDEPDATVDELLTIVQGPDFPTGGIICGRQGIRDAYRRGRGSVIVRAQLHVEETKTGRKRIAVTEIPYQVTRSSIKEKIESLLQASKLPGVARVQDASDRQGQRLLIELKKGEDEQVVLNQLYTHTRLQDTFSIILLALVDGRPRTLNLREALLCYKRHRMEVIRRRTRFLLDRAERDAHILEGLKIALRHIDEVVAIIKASSDAEHAKARLREEFELSEVQADSIIQMRLGRLTALEQEKLEKDYRALLEKIAEYTSILENEGLVLNIIKQDLIEMKEKYGDDRRTVIDDRELDGEITREDLIAEEQMVVTVTHGGYVKRHPLALYRKQHRGGKGVTGAGVKEGDFVQNLFTASTHDHVLFFTDCGRVYWRKVFELPELSRISKGRALVNLLNLSDETVTSIIPVPAFDDRHLCMATSRGTVKKTLLSAFRHPNRAGIRAIRLEKEERLIGVDICDEGQQIILCTRHGMAVRFDESEARSMGRAAHGVRGIKLRQGDRVVDMVVADSDSNLLTACENGYGKRTRVGAYRLQSRGGYGVINIKTSDRNGPVVGVMPVDDEDDVMMITSGGMIVRIPVQSIRLIGRNTQGVRLIALNEGDTLVAMARVAREDERDDAEAVGSPKHETGAAPADGDETSEGMS